MSAQKNFENNVKEVCRKKGITQKKLAEMLKIDPASLSRMIKGNPRLDTIERIAETLNVSVSTLLEDNEHIDGYISINGRLIHIRSKEEFLSELEESHLKINLSM